jgi:branched-chain amino acid transport system permease protein
MKKYLPKTRVSYLVILAMTVLPLCGFNSYLMHLAIMALMWTVVGMGWNVLGGYCGQVSFGHAAYFGVGAYTAGILNAQYGWSAWWGIPAGVCVVGVFAAAQGWVVLRLRGPFFALATLASGEVMRVTAENWTALTGGSRGILIPERTWVEKTWYYYIILGIVLATFGVVKRVVGSKLGYYFLAIREDQDAAESLGINTTWYKTEALCLSGMITGVAGAFYTNYMGYIDPNVVFGLHDISIVTIMIVMVGGVATHAGPVLGAVIMVLLAEGVRSLPGLGAAHQTVFGILLIVIIIYLPNGIVGDFSKLKRRVGLRRVWS